MIDLRSDTITKPTQGMLDAMMTAKVGDDVFGDDPTVNDFQSKVASLFGMEDAIFCPSGTMTNQIGMRILTDPQDEVICHKYSHVYLYEGGGMMANSLVSPKLLEGDRGMITADQIDSSINPDDIHFPNSKLVVLENTMNKGGGSTYSMEAIKEISESCKKNSLSLHLDGARIFNALVATGQGSVDYGQYFDTISVCFSKGLGCPIGSVLIGSKELIKKARRVRKALGGAMRQSGYLAAACNYALENNIERLAEDHLSAKQIGEILKTQNYIKGVYPAETNIVIAELEKDFSEQWMLQELEKREVYAVPFGKRLVRFVTHLEFNENHLNSFEEAVLSIKV